ncbi:hypothetical protein BKA82DRAFT_7045 [Pisolithus tinctorius]|nr:hypothetical protein BKA82DRAFT_7045 [Pisolithus tinctorius]
MASPQFQITTIQLICLNQMFPVSMIQDSSEIPHAGGMRQCQGTISLAPNDMYIFCNSEWVQWEPKTALHLSIVGDDCIIAPCPINGIWLLVKDTSYLNYLISMAEEFHQIRFQDLPTNADILQLMGMYVLEKQGDGVIGRAQKPLAEAPVPVQEADVGGTGSGKWDDGAVKGAPIASTSQSRKGKGREALEPEGHCTMSEKKRHRTEDVEPITEQVPFLNQITCPSDTKVIDWESLNIRTYTPWFSKVDYDAIEYMSKATCMTEYQYGHGWTMLVELKCDGDKESLAQLITNISDSLSRGCAVLVRGWKPNHPPLDFTCEDIGFFHPTISQEVVNQDALKHVKQQEAKGGARHEQSV